MSDEDDGSDCGPSLPAGVLRSRGGWAGDSLEIDHQRETLLQNSGNNKAAHAAVDLSQFRNEEVGKGYQAKHVIRQAGAQPKTSGIVDMSKKDENDASKPKPNGTTTTTTTTETYLACRGMRNFIREVDKILENP